MKPDIHPTTNNVIFVDTSSGAEFVTTSTLSSEETRDINGVPHHVIKIEISSASHPFFTGEERFVDTAGRVDKFKAKLDLVEAAAEKRKGKKAKAAARAAAKKQDETPAPKKAKKEKEEEKVEEVTPENAGENQPEADQPVAGTEEPAVEAAPEAPVATEETKTEETTTEA